MRLSRCSRPSGPLERAPLTALWASVAAPPGVHGTPPTADRDLSPADAADPSCDAYWTADERYVLRVAEGTTERWYVGELEASDAAAAPVAPPLGDVAEALASTPRPPRDAGPLRTRTMLVGRQRGRRTAPPAMRLHVRRPPRA